MSIRPEDLRTIAKLARIGISKNEVAPLLEDLNGILGHMDVLQQVDVAGTSEFAHRQATPMRDDVVAPQTLAHARESFAPLMRDGFFLVPRLATHDAVGAAGSAVDTNADVVPDEYRA